MYCKFCGNKIEQGAKFCTRCGSTVSGTEESRTDENYAPEVISSYCEAELETAAKKSLIFGILSLAIGSVVGFIFALLSARQVRKYADLNGGYVSGKAKAGKILSTIGIPYGIVSFIYAIVVIAGIASILA